MLTITPLDDLEENMPTITPLDDLEENIPTITPLDDFGVSLQNCQSLNKQFYNDST